MLITMLGCSLLGCGAACAGKARTGSATCGGAGGGNWLPAPTLGTLHSWARLCSIYLFVAMRSASSEEQLVYQAMLPACLLDLI